LVRILLLPNAKYSFADTKQLNIEHVTYFEVGCVFLVLKLTCRILQRRCNIARGQNPAKAIPLHNKPQITFGVE
jgi:hypothetical protein